MIVHKRVVTRYDKLGGTAEVFEIYLYELYLAFVPLEGQKLFLYKNMLREAAVRGFSVYLSIPALPYTGNDNQRQKRRNHIDVSRM